MESYFFIGGLVGFLFIILCDLSCEPIRNKWRKDCNYDCSKCKVWDCQKKKCDLKKSKYFSKEVTNE